MGVAELLQTLLQCALQAGVHTVFLTYYSEERSAIQTF